MGASQIRSTRSASTKTTSRRSRSALARLGDAVIETLERRVFLDGSAPAQLTFSPPSSISIGLAGSVPQAVVSADLGNGQTDLVSIDNFTNIHVLVGNGDGTFNNSSTLFADGLACGPTFVAVAQLSGTDHPDIIAADNLGHVDIFPGNGDGTFNGPTTLTFSLSPTGIAIANVGGTTSLVVNNSNGTVSVLRGDGEGGLDSPTNYSTAYTSGGGPLVVGDFANNSYSDVAVVNTQYNAVSILVGGETGFTVSNTDYLVGNSPNGITAVDLTNNGTLDLATSNDNGTITVLPGNGDATFQQPRTISVASNTSGIVAGDFNGDGKQDLAVLTYNNGVHLTVLLGNGDFSFQSPQSFYAGRYGYTLTTGDFNGDGLPDVAVAGYYDQGLSSVPFDNSGAGHSLTPAAVPTKYGQIDVLIDSTGSHSFNTPQTLPGNGPKAVAVADLTTNRTADVVVANYTTSTVSVFMGNGDGTFQTAVTYPVSCGPTAILVADFNGDKIPDIVTLSGKYGELSVLLGNGNGTFKPAIYTSVGYSPVSVTSGAFAAADFDGDGNTDLAVAGALDGKVIELLGNGDGRFHVQQSVQVGNNSDNISSVAVGDLNADGHPDIVSTDETNSEVYVLINNGDGTFKAPTDYSVGNAPIAVALADLTNNGKLDIVTANEAGGSISVLLGNGNGTFASPQSFPDFDQYGPVSISIADFNGDGNLDVITANPYLSGNSNGDRVNLLLGNGDGTFQQVGDLVVGNDPTSVVVSDVNGDHKPDVITTNYHSNSISVLLNTSNGPFTHTFGDPNPISTGNAPYFVTTADLNGDGNQDLIVANYNTGTIDVILGNGNGTFKAAEVFSVGCGPSSIIATDLNADGTLDLVVADAGGDQISVLMGNGDGTFKSAVTTSLSGCGPRIDVGPNSIAAGDLNGDGKPDLVIADVNDQISVLLNNGSGGFTSVTQVSITSIVKPNVTAYGIALADLTGNGKLDAVITDTYSGSSTGRVEVMLGNGDGTFAAAAGYYNVGNNPTSLAIADLNGDGHPDVVVANRYSSTVSILHGNGNGTFASAITDPTGVGPIEVTVSDVLNSGRLDILTADAGISDSIGHQVSVLIQNSNGTFASPEFVNVGNFPRSVAVADVNNDQLPDVITANTNDNTISVVLNESPNAPSITQNAQGTVTATGTSGGDLVTLTVVGGNLRVTVDGETQSFPIGSVTGINVDPGAGNDSVVINTGVPALNCNGGPGNDTISDNGSSNNTLIGGGGADSIAAGSGADNLQGGSGNDTVTGGGSGTQMAGGVGDDVLKPAAGHETVHGNIGNDTIIGTGGSDLLGGDGGDDVILDSGFTGDVVNGGGGLNFAQYNPNSTMNNIYEDLNPTNQPPPSTVTSPAALIGNPSVNASVVGGKLKIVGSSGTDTIVVSVSGSNVLVTANSSGPEPFPLAGLSGIKVVESNGHNNTVTIQPAVLLPATIQGGTGNDTFTGGGAENVIIGGGGNDMLIGGAGMSLLIPGTGNVQSAPDGNVTLIGGTGFAIADFSRRTDLVTLSNNGTATSGDTAAGEHDEIATSIQGLLTGSDKMDVATGTTPGMLLSGGNGKKDTLTGGAGDLIVSGLSGLSLVDATGEPLSIDTKNGVPDTISGLTDPTIDFINDDPGIDSILSGV